MVFKGSDVLFWEYSQQILPERMEVEEVQKRKPLFHILETTNTLTIIEGVLDFLDLEEIISIGELVLSCGVKTKFFMVALARAFMGKYLNRVDRSVFFVFYEDVDFHNIEKRTSNLLASSQSSLLAHEYFSYSEIFKAFDTYSSFLEGREDFLTILEQLYLEPDLPMPKLKRETIGMFCQTGFQEYLSLIKFPPESPETDWQEPVVEQLREKLQLEFQQLTETMIYSDYGNEETSMKIREIRFCGFRVGSNNWKSYLLPNFKNHNLIVLMLALCSHMVTTFHHLLNAIEDPFMRFTEFALRSNIYRNIVLSIEEKMKFVFTNYSDFYEVCFKPEKQYPSFNFWRPALSIWTQQMKCFHPFNQKVYNYISSKLREKNLKELLALKTQKLPSFFSAIKRQMDLQVFSLGRKQQLYHHKHLQMEGFIQNNEQMYSTLAKDYLQYMVDISMNEINVHWCGHSDHNIKHYPLFQLFLQEILEQSNSLYRFIQETIDRSVPAELRINIFKQIVKEDLSFSEQQLFKPVIAKEISAFVNSQIKDKVEQMSKYAVFPEEGFIKHKVSMDFEEKDGVLSYFAAKYGIPEDCSLQQGFYYNIQIEDSEPVWLKEEREEPQEMEQYISDSEDEMLDQKENK